MPVHLHTRDHLPRKTRIDRFNSWLAVKITAAVGSMWCAYAFAAIALYGLPQALKPGGEGIVSWIAQTFLQLVLLSIILVGSNVTAAAADARSAKTFEDAEQILTAIAGLNAKVDALTTPAAVSRETSERLHQPGTP
jgi:Zn-dependent protease with chaperone function